MAGMTEERVNCTSCRAKDVDPAHVERCAIRTKARADAIAHGRSDTVLIHGAKTDDLWAHAFTRTGDPEIARDIAKVVIDLGWRPVVGKYDTWTPPTPDQPAQGASDDTTER